MNEWNKRFFDKFEMDGLTYDDVSLVVQKSSVVPVDVNITTRLSQNIILNIPFVSADMDTVTESEMAVEMAKLGGLGFIWKCDIETQSDLVDAVKFYSNAKIENPVAINLESTLDNVMDVLEEYDERFSSLVVVKDDNTVCGLMTRHEAQFHSSTDKVKDMMNKDLISAPMETDVDSAYMLMKEKHKSKLILVDSENRLKGLYCWTDVKDIIENTNPSYNRDSKGQLRVGANVGICNFRDTSQFDHRVTKLLDSNCDVLLVGTAHGHSDNVINTVKYLKENFKRHNFDIVAGNVATFEGAEELCLAGANAIKVGVGPGAICTTRVVSGAGVPQLTAVYNAARAAAQYDVPVIADGGIRYSGDVTKAIAAGASSVMMGSIMAATDESPGEKIEKDGKLYVYYRGMGSLGAMESSKDSRERYKQKEKLVPEGVETLVPYRGTVEQVIGQFTGGLQSGCGYIGAKDLLELVEKGKFVKISAAGNTESHPHDVTMLKDAPNYHGKN